MPTTGYSYDDRFEFIDNATGSVATIALNKGCATAHQPC